MISQYVIKYRKLLTLLTIGCLYTLFYKYTPKHEMYILKIKNGRKDLSYSKQVVSPWQQVLSPCKDATDWLKRVRNRKDLTYAPNTVVKVQKLSNNKTYKIVIYTADNTGKNKMIGGDSWLIKIKSEKTCFSIDLLDNLDGSYKGYFTLPQAGNYSVDIVIDYSLCEGVLDPPLNYFKSATFQGSYHKQPMDEMKYFLNKKLQTKYIEAKISHNNFHGCNYKLPVQCQHLNSKYGYWYKSTYKHCSEIDSQKEERINPTVFKQSENKIKNRTLDTLLVYGDSLSRFFYQSIKEKDICKHLFKNCRNVLTWSYVRGRYSTDLQDRTFYDNKDFNETIFFDGISHALKNPSMHSNKSVVLVNFGIHMIKSLQYQRMMDLFIKFLDYIHYVKRKLGTSAPLFIWKSITQPGQVKKYYDDIRFMTAQRASIWNEFTIQEGCKRNLSFLHIYHMSSSYPNGTRDQSHYENLAFIPAETALYKYLQYYDFD